MAAPETTAVVESPPAGATPPEPEHDDKETTAAERLGQTPADPSAEGAEPSKPPDHRATFQRATEGVKGLEQKLARLLPPAPPAGDARSGPVPPPPRWQPPAPPSQPLVLPLVPQDFNEAYDIYTNKAYDDRQAFQAAFRHMFTRYHERFLQNSVEPLANVASQKAMGQIRKGQRVKQIQGEIEGWWKQMGPQVPAELCWAYVHQAEAAHPGDLSKQALFCFGRALEAIGGSLNGYQTPPLKQSDRAQGAMLAGGEGTGGGRGGREAPPQRMADQLRSYTHRLRHPAAR